MLLALFISLLFSISLIVNKQLLQTLPVFFFIGLRMTCAGFILLLLTHRSSKQHYIHAKADWKLIVLIAWCTTLIPALLKAYAIKNLLIARTVLLSSLDLAATAIFSYSFFKERLSARKGLSVVIVLLGVLLLFFYHTPSEYNLPSIFSISYAELAFIAYIFISRLGWTLMQRLLKKDQYTSAQLNALTMLSAGTIILLVSIAYQQACWYTLINYHLALMFAYTVLVGTVLGHTLYGSLLKKHSAYFVTLTGFYIPIFSIILGRIVLHEHIFPFIIVPATCLGIGTYMFYNEEK